MVVMAGVALAATLKGTAGTDKIVGTTGGDHISGLRGDDYLNGKAGKDKVIGGDGRDLVLGGGGADRLRGGNGVDHFRGGSGDDYISSVGDDSRGYVSCGPGYDTVEKIPGVKPFDSFADDCEKVKSVALKLDVEKISSGAWDLRRQQVVVASSATALSGAINQRVPDSGEGTYFAAYRGQKPSCGHSVAIKSADRTRDQVTTGLVLRDPSSDAMVCAAFTQPYAIAVIKDLNPRGLEFTFEDQRGKKLDWPVRRTSG